MNDKIFDLAGWAVFVLSALASIVSGLRSGDGFALASGVFFLIACLIFLYPFGRDWLRRQRTR
jgi:hypothetical protein